MRDGEGRFPHAIRVVEDVTERKRTEDALRESQERLSALVRATSEVLYSMSADWSEMRRLTGGGFLADTGRPNRAWLEEYIHPDDRSRVAAAIERAVRTKGVFELEHRVRRADGGWGWTLSRAVPILDAAGGIEEWFGAASDVTARREAEEALRRLNETLEARVAERTAERDRMWETSPDLMLVIDFDGVFRRVNPAWMAVLGYAPDELVGHHVNEFVVPDDHGETIDAYGFAARGGRPAIENRYRHKDGSSRWISWVAAPAGDMTYATGRDITAEKGRQAELERAQEQLRQAQKMEAVGQLTGGIAHDFNNMLQGIGGALELMRRRAAQGRTEEADRLGEMAAETVGRAAALTHRLLAFARRQALDPEPVEPNALVAGMAELIRRAVGPDVRVELREGDGAWTVLCDPNGLENALLNLAINARDAMPSRSDPSRRERSSALEAAFAASPCGTDRFAIGKGAEGRPMATPEGVAEGGGTLAIATADVRLSAADVAGHEGAPPGDYVEVSVSDTGAGMDEATQARAFEPFFTTKPIGQGTGLGLSQVYGFVRQSGGVVRLDSAPGRGTTVRLYLPRHEPAPEPGERPASEGDPGTAGAGEAVLLVEDEAAVRAVAAEHLREAGYRVLEAGDGPAALRLLRSGARVDLLVTDVGLPGGLNGRQVAEAAREGRPGLPVLFVTGYAGGALDGRLAPGMEAIGKPFALGALAARVRAMLEAAPAG